MRLVSHCPNCGTSFRVVPDQLRIAQGWVRCGQCMHVYRAYSTLTKAPEDVPHTPPPAPPASSPQPRQPAAPGAQQQAPAPHCAPEARAPLVELDFAVAPTAPGTPPVQQTPAPAPEVKNTPDMAAAGMTAGITADVAADTAAHNPADAADDAPPASKPAIHDRFSVSFLPPEPVLMDDLDAHGALMGWPDASESPKNTDPIPYFLKKNQGHTADTPASLPNTPSQAAPIASPTTNAEDDAALALTLDDAPSTLPLLPDDETDSAASAEQPASPVLLEWQDAAAAPENTDPIPHPDKENRGQADDTPSSLPNTPSQAAPIASPANNAEDDATLALTLDDAPSTLPLLPDDETDSAASADQPASPVLLEWQDATAAPEITDPIPHPDKEDRGQAENTPANLSETSPLETLPAVAAADAFSDTLIEQDAEPAPMPAAHPPAPSPAPPLPFPVLDAWPADDSPQSAEMPPAPAPDTPTRPVATAPAAPAAPSAPATPAEPPVQQAAVASTAPSDDIDTATLPASANGVPLQELLAAERRRKRRLKRLAQEQAIAAVQAATHALENEPLPPLPNAAPPAPPPQAATDTAAAHPVPLPPSAPAHAAHHAAVPPQTSPSPVAQTAPTVADAPAPSPSSSPPAAAAATVEAVQAEAPPPEPPPTTPDDDAPAPPADADIAAMQQLSFVRQAQQRAYWQSWPVRLALHSTLALGTLLLALQWLLFNRDMLAAQSLLLRPVLVNACATLHCTVQPWKHIQAVRLDNDQLRKLGERTYRLSWGVRNSASHPVAMPALEVTLITADDRIIARRVLDTATYGAPGVLTARGEWNGSVLIEAPAGARTAGEVAHYRVGLFYP